MAYQSKYALGLSDFFLTVYPVMTSIRTKLATGDDDNACDHQNRAERDPESNFLDVAQKNRAEKHREKRRRVEERDHRGDFPHTESGEIQHLRARGKHGSAAEKWQAFSLGPG